MPASNSHDDLQQLEQALLRLRRVTVAFSGGVDSSLVLAAATRALGPKDVVAVTGVSPALAEEQRLRAISVAAELGVPHELLDTREFEDERYVSNPTNRCFYCKSELYGRMKRMPAAQGRVVVDGTNADDLGDHRPGIVAARENGVVSPLADLGFGKERVRAMSRRLNLATADLPASPCLASRIPYHSTVTPERLSLVERAESAVRALGFREFRVRWMSEDSARLEVAAAEHRRLADPDITTVVVAAITGAGFRRAFVDPRPFRSGRLNEGMGEGETSR